MLYLLKLLLVAKLLLVVLLALADVACFLAFPDHIEGATLMQVLVAPFSDEPMFVCE